MVEEKEFKKGEERISGDITPLFPRSTLLQYKKRKKKTPVPLSCHGCGLAVRTNWPLRILPSDWRIALLCAGCISAVDSAAACSYCFSNLSGGSDGLGSLDCRQCRRRVHRTCIPHHHPYLRPSRFVGDSFDCIDCCPILKPQGSSIPKVSDSEWKAVVKKANEAVSDAELALQLHLAVNGSQRISRNLGSRSCYLLVEPKGLQTRSDSVGRNAEFDSCSTCVDAEDCNENGFCSAVVETVEEDWGIRSEKVANDSGDTGIGTTFASYHRPTDPDIATSFRQDSCDPKQKGAGGTLDRYLKKYRKRNSRLKDAGVAKECNCPVLHAMHEGPRFI